MAMSNQLRYGRYAVGGYTIVNGNKLDWWEPVTFDKSSTDVTFELIQKYQYRPDLVAYDMYGKPELQWFVMQYNNFSDVMTEFTAGTTIVLPTGDRLFGEMLVKVTQPVYS